MPAEPSRKKARAKDRPKGSKPRKRAPERRDDRRPSKRARKQALEDVNRPKGKKKPRAKGRSGDEGTAHPANAADSNALRSTGRAHASSRPRKAGKHGKKKRGSSESSLTKRQRRLASQGSGPMVSNADSAASDRSGEALGGGASQSGPRSTGKRIFKSIISDEQAISRSRAVKARQRTEPPGRGTPFEAYFAAEPLPASRPTLIFQHLQKTAGTAMRDIIHTNVMGQNQGAVEHVVLDVRKTNDGAVPLRDWYRDWWSSLTADERARLILATSHSANYLLDIIERPARAFTIVREPADRVASRYYFRTNPPRWSLRDLYRNPTRFPRVRGQFFNYQSRALLEPHFDIDVDDLAMSNGPPADAPLWRERLWEVLNTSYVVGAQEHFHETVTLFAREFGWSMTPEPHVRVNRERPRESDDSKTRELIVAYNWLDAELHDECLRRIDGCFSRTTI